MRDPEKEEKDKIMQIQLKAYLCEQNRAVLVQQRAPVAWSWACVLLWQKWMRTSHAVQCIGQLFLLNSVVHMIFQRYPCYPRSPCTPLGGAPEGEDEDM